MKSNLFLIVEREYKERVKRKAFIISTFLMPIFLVALMVLPALIMVMSGPEDKTIAVVDASGVVAPTMQNDTNLKFEAVSPNISLDSLKRMENYDAVLVVGSNIVDKPGNLQLFTHSAPSIQTETFIRNQVEHAISAVRKQRLDIPDIDKILAEIDVEVTMSTYRLDREEETETSSATSYFIALGAAMLLYMFILIYGQMVMNSIIEEKNNRVLEVVVSSVKPKVLMLGKVLGIGCVAVTQIVIWGVIIGCVTRWVMPLITSAVPSDDQDLAVALGQISDTGYMLSILGYIMLFMVAGYMLYSSIFAAIGSSVDNVQDAAQLTSIPTIPILIGIMIAMAAMHDPNSGLAFWCSMIPFTSPMVMMSRIPFGIPGWQIWVSLAILVVTFLFMIWLSAKIYRVGIFMYGKKPSVKDLIRWAQYR